MGSAASIASLAVSQVDHSTLARLDLTIIAAGGVLIALAVWNALHGRR